MQLGAMQASSSTLPVAQSEQQGGFSMDGFDFNADFSLPGNLDDLTIFSAPTGNHASSDNASTSAAVTAAGSAARRTSLESHADSPHTTQSSTNGKHSSESVSSPQTTMKNLHNLLNNIDASAASQQQYQRQLQDGNLPIDEVERLMSEKEQIERAQNVQSAFLRQQLEMMQKQSPKVFQSQTAEGSGMQSQISSAAHLMQQFQQFQSQQQQQQQQQSQHAQDANYSQFINGNGPYGNHVGKPGMNSYGLITPASSGAFHRNTHLPFVSPLNMDQASSAAAINGVFTPLESPAITPASVFSNLSSTSTSADLFSPLTSPALRPQTHAIPDAFNLQMSPFHGAIKTRGKTRGASGTSPATMTATKSIPRKNRSTTAEARANRAKASPLVAPTMSSRKRAESSSGRTSNEAAAGVHLRSKSLSRQASQSDHSTPQAFPPLSAGSGSAKPMDASPSEAAASTPSPIEMPPPNGKPITPGSLMGIGNPQKSAMTADGANGRATKLSKVDSERSSSSSSNSKQVSFAQSPNDLQSSAMPNEMSNQEREAWISSMKSTGGGGGGLESRRTSHKAAEQKRRDSLKFCFDELRGMLPAITLDDDVPGGSMLGPDGLLEDQNYEGFSIDEVGDAEGAKLANRAISKVALLRHSNEYLIRLKQRIGRRERDLAICRREVMELRSRLNIPIPPEMPTLTVNVAQSAAAAGHAMNGIVALEGFPIDHSDPHQVALLAATQQQLHQQHSSMDTS